MSAVTILSRLLNHMDEGLIKNALKAEGYTGELTKAPESLLEKVASRTKLQPRSPAKIEPGSKTPEILEAEVVPERALPGQTVFDRLSLPEGKATFKSIPEEVESPAAAARKRFGTKAAAGTALAAAGGAAFMGKPDKLPAKELPVVTTESTLGEKPLKLQETAKSVKAEAKKLLETAPPETKDTFNERLEDLDNLRKTAREAYEADKSRIETAEIAGLFGKALTQLGAGLHGLKTGVDMSGTKFDTKDWSRDYDRAAEELRSKLAEISAKEEVRARKAEREEDRRFRREEAATERTARAAESAKERALRRELSAAEISGKKEVARDRAGAAAAEAREARRKETLGKVAAYAEELTAPGLSKKRIKELEDKLLPFMGAAGLATPTQLEKGLFSDSNIKDYAALAKKARAQIEGPPPETKKIKGVVYQRAPNGFWLEVGTEE